jgi:hypothetical protein
VRQGSSLFFRWRLFVLKLLCPVHCCCDGLDWLQDDGKLRLLYRHQQGTTVHCFKGTCTLPAPLEVRTAPQSEAVPGLPVIPFCLSTWGQYAGISADI